MAVNDLTASSGQLAARSSTATESSSPQTIDGCVRNGLMSTKPECVLERHSGLTPGVMALDVIFYHGRSNLLRIESNLNSNRYVREVLQPEVVLFLQVILGASFQQNSARSHVSKTIRDFSSAQHMQLLPCPAYSPDISPSVRFG
ncbi:hypothetical protein TNCV_3820811 [Trichonephila clavipes]|nr:hypothetical protein TNCV_3820811 [Trichonephila clavipes]